MDKFKKYVKREMDVDYLACVHGMSMVFIYGLELYLTGVKSTPYAFIFQMFVLGYLIAWMQKLLFLREGTYPKAEFWIKAVSWCTLPHFMCMVTGRIFDWYEGAPVWLEPVFYLLMLCYYIMVFWSFQVFYKEDTKELNQLLEEYKQKGKQDEI